jgi:hypothetical protein
MTNIIKQFNSIVEDLLLQTTSLIGAKYLFNFKTIILCNSSMPIDKFTVNVLPYKHHIINRNLNFFINQDIDSYSNDIIDLKNIFLNISEESRNNIWDILHALIILCSERLAYKNNNMSCFA